MLQKIQVENFNRIIRDQEKYDFNIDADGVYLILFSARCKNWRQNFRRLFNDDDLALQIDDYLFAEIRGKKREFSNAGSWNGNELKNRVKDILIVLPLKKGIHAIKFWVGERPFLEKIEIYKIDITGSREINLLCPDIEKFNGFRDVIIKNLAVSDLTVKSRAEKNDKLELKVDGKIQSNPKYKRYAKWFWYGQELQGALKEYKASYCLEGGVHSLEFRGQGQPTIESIKIKISSDRLRYKVGRVRLYKDIILSDSVNLHLEPSQGSKILAELKDGDELEIVDERAVGEYIENLSEIWHKVIYQDKRGFILSSFVEIEGQEREKVIDLIKEKCWQYDADANIMLAIAGKESHYKPYAQSVTECQGIFQLAKSTADWVKIIDRYDIFQNIDGGVRNYKAIEKKFVGRGNILEKRLVAWHDGINSIPVKGILGYSKLRDPDQTKSFVRSVMENIKKKDWFYIISLSVLVFLAVSNLLIGYLIIRDRILTGRENSGLKITLIGPNQEATILSGADLIERGPLFENEINYKISPTPEPTPAPAVIVDNGKNEIYFLNSRKIKVAVLKVRDLNINEIFEVSSEGLMFDKIYTHVNSSVLEYPKNVFYFFASNSLTCGVNNCTFAFFRFNVENKNLELISKTVFGEVMGLYLSPDSKHLTVWSSIHNSVCSENSYISIFDLKNFEMLEVKNYFDRNFDAHYIKEFSWKNSKEIEFKINYSKCADPKAKRTIWWYNIDERKIRKIKSELFDLNLSG